jgi:hypothetical protein
LRFRVVDITTAPTQPLASGIADLRLLSSPSVIVPVTGGSKTALGMTLDQPTQSLGGGYNSSITATLSGGGIAPNASVDVQFVLGVQQAGSFRFFVIVEALP